MSLLPPTWDPRRAKQPAADPGETQKLDASLAVLADHVEAARTDRRTKDGHPVYFLEMTGRVNGSKDRAALPFLLSPDGVANTVARLLSAARGDPAVEAALAEHLREPE